jgi:hypothetical protein
MKPLLLALVTHLALSANNNLGHPIKAGLDFGGIFAAGLIGGGAPVNFGNIFGAVFAILIYWGLYSWVGSLLRRRKKA